jgi:hypothetical protein
MIEELKTPTFRQHNIDMEFFHIMTKIKGGQLYGEVINMESLKELVVASYYAGNLSVELPWKELEEFER